MLLRYRARVVHRPPITHLVKLYDLSELLIASNTYTDAVFTSMVVATIASDDAQLYWQASI